MGHSKRSFSKTTLDLALPFAGEYSVTFGASTPAGPVYGEPYTFKVETNNFAMLEDPIWLTLQVEWARAVSGFPLTRTLVLAVVRDR